LDADTAGVLDRELSTQVRSGDFVVLDLSEIGFIDASGLGVLLRAEVNARFARTEFSLIPGDCVAAELDALVRCDARQIP
jgi:anti-anti-sigma regulatory factor